jgi:serine/threonine protein kinase
MIEELQQFGSLSVAHRTGGAPVELMRSKEEVVFLAFDNRIRRLVELHVLRGGSTLDAALKRSAFDRARQASEIRGHSFMRILEVGEDQGLVYYTSNLNDGEFIDDYIKRRGALAPATALAMVYQLLDDLLQLKGYQRLVSRMHLDRVLVTTLEDTFLQLRIFDYGLSQMDTGEEESGSARLVVEVCRLIFRLLTGQADSGGNPDRFPALTQLPMNLRITVRAALTDPANAPTSIEKLRDDVREAFSALVSSIQARNLRKQLVVNAALLPQSHLQELLLENVPVETIMGTRFRVEDADHTRRYPFSIPAVNAKAEQPVTVHLLPPSRIVEKTRYEAVPLQMWRFNPERHPNILRSLSLWESPDWTFLTEEREPGFALSRLMAERLTLNPAEVLVLMRQIRAGLDQAVECGVQRVDLHPSNILLRVGKNGPLLARELERLMQKRLDAWPAFVVKLRPHMTMRSLYEPLLVDTDIADTPQEEHLLDRDFRHRSFVTLAAYLLTGERLGGGAPQFAESVPEAAATYVRECMELTRRAGKSPTPGDFIENFERLLSAPTVDLATRLRGSSVAIEEMESVGSVSDFDEDWSGNGAEEEPFEDTALSPIKRAMKTHDFNPLNPQKRSLPWGVLAAAAVVVLGIGAWMLIPGGKPVEAVVSSVLETPLTPALAESAPAETPTSPKTVAEKKVEAPEETKPVPPTVPIKPVVVAVKTPVMKSQPPGVVPPAEAKPTDKPAEMAVVPPTQAVVKVDKSADVTLEKPPVTAPLPPKDPVTIRRAIVPTQEEIERMKQGHVENRTGRLPAMSTASPLPPQNKTNP